MDTTLDTLIGHKDHLSEDNNNNNNNSSSEEMKKSINFKQQKDNNTDDPQQKVSTAQKKKFKRKKDKQPMNRFGTLASDEENNSSSDSQQQQQQQHKGKKKRTKGNNIMNNSNGNSNNNNNSPKLKVKSSGDIFTDIYGKDAKVEIELIKRRNGCVLIKDIQQYLLWLLSDFQVQIPPWIFTRNKPLLQKVVLISLTGINFMMYEKATLLTGKQWFDMLPLKVPLNIPSNSIITPPNLSFYNHLFSIKSQRTTKPPPVPKGPQPPVTTYILSEEDLIENGYPLKNELLKGGWVITTKESQINQLIAIDCEMCRTNEGLELARISIINESKRVILDEYVKPENEIIDYLTQYSGITKDTLENVTTKLVDIQTKLLELIDKSTIVIGHSLENDFKAMKFIHGRVIDTSVIYPTGASNKFPLRYLTKKYLNRVIQNNAGGHSSIEDAIAVMDLVKLKVARGKTFGTKADNNENLFNKLNQFKKRATFVDTIEEINQHSHETVSSFKSSSDQETVDRVSKQVKGSSDLIITRLYQLTNYYKSIDQFKPIYKPDGTILNINNNNDNDLNNIDTTITTTTTTTNTTMASRLLTISCSSEQVEEKIEEKIEEITSSSSSSFTLNPLLTKIPTPIVVDEDVVKELDELGGIPANQELYDQLDKVRSSIATIWEQMTPNSIMMLMAGPGPYNEINRFRNVEGKEKDFVIALEGSKEGFLMLGVK